MFGQSFVKVFCTDGIELNKDQNEDYVYRNQKHEAVI